MRISDACDFSSPVRTHPPGAVTTSFQGRTSPARLPSPPTPAHLPCQSCQRLPETPLGEQPKEVVREVPEQGQE